MSNRIIGYDEDHWFNNAAMSYRIFSEGDDITDHMSRKERIDAYSCWLASCPDVEHLDFVKDDE